MNNNAKIAIFMIAFYFVVNVILLFMYPLHYMLAIMALICLFSL